MRGSPQNVGSSGFQGTALASKGVDPDWMREDVLSGEPDEMGQADPPLPTPT
jgi:hypothetical protein